MEKMRGEIDKIDKVLDIKGEECPYTFVRSKLALEDMESGQVLKVIVDHEPATKNVPRSMENEGNKVLDISKINDTDWQIIVKKG
ncbi:MAG: sulfurtransferase TusA family protein [Nitrospinae bacterium]|nr:sulfurtransferase TusA family protein [Nitrospinota bacterium]